MSVKIMVEQDGVKSEEFYAKAMDLAKQQEKGLLKDIRFFWPNSDTELFLIQVYGRDKLGRYEV